MSGPVLSIGDKGAAVGVLHQALIEQGFDCDGDTFQAINDFGLATESAVKLFQACHIGPNKENLTVDGIVGPATWWALDHSSGSDKHQPITNMPIQVASNPIAAAALASALVELSKDVREVPDGSNRGPEIESVHGHGRQTHSSGRSSLVCILRVLELRQDTCFTFWANWRSTNHSSLVSEARSQLGYRYSPLR